MAIFQIWLDAEATQASRAGKFEIIDIPKLNTLEDMIDAIHDDDLLRGQILHTASLGEMRFRVTRRVDVLVRGGMITRCQANIGEIVADEDVAA